jgi:hypothetical protein
VTEPLPLGTIENAHCQAVNEPPTTTKKYVTASVSMTSKADSRTKLLTEDVSNIGLALAGGHLPSLAKAVVNHEPLYELIFSLILDRIDVG